jgi:lipoyl(octanoyl) transferase
LIEWINSNTLIDYEYAVNWMKTRSADISTGQKPECIWFLEHPPIYTAGTSAKDIDLKDNNGFPVYKSNRGGQYTYHGPGQRVAYVLLDLNNRGRDVKKFVKNLELWIINTLAAFNIRGETHPGRVGVWVTRKDKPLTGNGIIAEEKIAAIGIRLSKWVSYHGISINLDPNLEHFSGIVPCGISDRGVTSLTNLGISIRMEELDALLKENFYKIFEEKDV